MSGKPSASNVEAIHAGLRREYLRMARPAGLSSSGPMGNAAFGAFLMHHAQRAFRDCGAHDFADAMDSLMKAVEK